MVQGGSSTDPVLRVKADHFVQEVDGTLVTALQDFLLEFIGVGLPLGLAVAELLALVE